MITTQFATKTSDEVEEENFRHSPSNCHFDIELSHHVSNEQSQQFMDTSAIPSLSMQASSTMMKTREIVNELPQQFIEISAIPSSSMQASNRMNKTSEPTSEKSQELILAKIDGLDRKMTKGFANLSKSGDNNYNDIKAMIPTHSLVEFDAFDAYQKMKRYLQRYLRWCQTKIEAGRLCYRGYVIRYASQNNFSIT